MQYYYPQQNQKPQYPPQPGQYRYAPPPVMPPVMPQLPPQEIYRRKLRKVVNGVGGLLLFFFGLELILVTLFEAPMLANGMINLFSDDVFILLFNGVISLIIFFVAGLIYCLIRKLSFASLFPFSRIGAGKLWKLVIIGLAVSLMSNYVVDLINNTFGLFGIDNNGGSIDAGSNPNILIYVLTVAVLPALGEEFAFRGVIMGAIRPYSEGLAILVSSSAFALMHGNFVQLPFTFCCGLAFAYIDIKTNSLLPSILIHFLNNGISVLIDILTSYGIVDYLGSNLIFSGIILILCILSFIFIKKYSQKQPELFKLSGGNEGIPFRKKVTTVTTSPTMIVYTVLMLLYCVYVMILNV